jgi:hypothetical protein
MRSTRRIVALATLTITLGLVAAPAGAAPAAPTATAAAAAAPYCGITWGSLPDVSGAYTGALITNVRAGRHACWDRLVVDLGPGPITGYDVRYVSQVTQDGSGAVVPLAGGADMQVLVRAPGYNSYTGQPSYAPANPSQAVNVAGYTTFRQVAWAGSFEGQSLIGLGVRARLPFRTFVLTNPGGGHRLVIDVAHRW